MAGRMPKKAKAAFQWNAASLLLPRMVDELSLFVAHLVGFVNHWIQSPFDVLPNPAMIPATNPATIAGADPSWPDSRSQPNTGIKAKRETLAGRTPPKAKAAFQWNTASVPLPSWTTVMSKRPVVSMNFCNYLYLRGNNKGHLANSVHENLHSVHERAPEHSCATNKRVPGGLAGSATNSALSAQAACGPWSLVGCGFWENDALPGGSAMTGALKVWSPPFGASGNREVFHCRNGLFCDLWRPIPAMIPATVAGIGPFIGPLWPDSGGCDAVPLKARLADRTIGHNSKYLISRLFLFGHSPRMADRPHCRDDQTEDGRAGIEGKLSVSLVGRTVEEDSVIQDFRITATGDGDAKASSRKGKKR